MKKLAIISGAVVVLLLGMTIIGYAFDPAPPERERAVEVAPTPKPKPPEPEVAPEPESDRYPEPIREAFLEVCNAEAPGFERLCECGLEKFEARYSLRELMEMSNAKAERLGTEYGAQCVIEDETQDYQ